NLGSPQWALNVVAPRERQIPNREQIFCELWSDQGMPSCSGVVADATEGGLSRWIMDHGAGAGKIFHGKGRRAHRIFGPPTKRKRTQFVYTFVESRARGPAMWPPGGSPR